MTLKRFLDCGYALLVEAYVRVPQDLVGAVDRVNESLGLPLLSGAAEGGSERVPGPSENDLAMAELQKLMGGLA